MAYHYYSNSNDHAARPHPHIYIPPGAQAPVNPSTGRPTYSVEVTPPHDLVNPWDRNDNEITPTEQTELTRRNRTFSAVPSRDSQLAPRADLYRASSSRSSLRHRPSKSDVGPVPPSIQHTASFQSENSAYYNPEDFVDEADARDLQLSRELSNLSLESEEGLRKFQNSELPEADQQWHRLVPVEAREALGKKEVQRQSVLFEVFTSEREYVNDLQAVKDVFIIPLRDAEPPIIPKDRLSGFISEVFWNLDSILSFHLRMLAMLFERQREQHPLIQSVADIVLDTVLTFRDEYESYIKHYPLAEARHRTELKRNPRYQIFLQTCSQDPRIRKRDIITFLSRPVSRLPRFGLILEGILKFTDAEHPDVEELPIILSILGDFIKSTQPGIAVSESKVKFWELCESLVFVKGEIVELDLYDDSRTLIHSGPLARRQRSEIDWHGWNDLTVALLDNFLLLTREETRSSGVIKRHVVSRPLPLEYLRLGSFDDPSETRKEAAKDGKLLENLRFHLKPMYPFTVYHVSSKSNRRYTLYTTNELGRKRWHDALVDAIGVHKVRAEANMYFAPQILSDKFFRVPGTKLTSGSGPKFNGRVTCAAPFHSGGKPFLAVGTATGIYVAVRGDANFTKVLQLLNPTKFVVLQDFNKFVVHHETNLLVYSIDVLARVTQGQAPPKTLDATLEKIASGEGNVTFLRSGIVNGRTIIVYAAKSFLQVTLRALEAVNPMELALSPTRTREGKGKQPPSQTFRPFGGPFYVPKDAYDATPLVKVIAISTEKSVVIVDPTNLTAPVLLTVPDFSEANGNLPMTQLKTRCETSRSLGVVRWGTSELLVVYDEMGCYINKHGTPTRNCGFIRWETKATHYAHRGNYILLFSPEFIEVRLISNGALVQAVEGSDIRLLHCGRDGPSSTLIAVMKGDHDDADGASEKTVELIETADLLQTPMSNAEAVWDEWDMA